MSGLAGKIAGSVRPYRGRFFGALAQIFLISAFAVLEPWPLRLVIDNVLGGKSLDLGSWAVWFPDVNAWPKLTLAAVLCVGLVLIVLVSGTLNVFYNWTAIGLGQRMVNDLRARLYAHLQRLSLAFHSRQKVGDLMMRITADSYAVQTMVMNGLLPILQAAVMLVGMLIVLLPIDPFLTGVALTIVPLLAILIGFFNRKIDAIATTARDTDSQVYTLVHWGMASIKHVQAFTKEEEEHRRFMAASGAALHAHRLLYSWQGGYSGVINTIVAAGMGLVIFVGARDVLNGTLTIGELVLFTTYLAKLYAPVNQITQSWGLIAGARIGAMRCFEILDTEADLQCDIRRAELQRCFQKRDGQHHAKPDEVNRDCDGPRETHVAGPLQRTMVFISRVEDTLSDTVGLGDRLALARFRRLQVVLRKPARRRGGRRAALARRRPRGCRLTDNA